MTRDREPNIVIREAWGNEKEVGFRGIEHIDMPEQEMLDLIDKYGDILIKLDEVEDKYEGLDWCWHIGRIVSQMDDRGDFAKLNRYTDIDIGDDWTLLRYVNFYKLFPDGDFHPDISKSVYFEFAVAERIEGSKRAYERLVNYNDGEIINPAIYEVRTWFNTESFELSAVVNCLLEEAKGQTTNLNIDKIHRGVRRVYIMEGKDPDIVERTKIQGAKENNVR